MKKLLLSLVLMVVFCGMALTSAQDVDFQIVPKSETFQGNEINAIAASGGSVQERYRAQAEEYAKMSNKKERLALQLSTGIMNWDTLLDYIVYLAKFIGQLGLLIAALVFILMGYKKAVEAFGGSAKSPIAMVIKGLLIIIFAYFIVRMLYNAFLS